MKKLFAVLLVCIASVLFQIQVCAETQQPTENEIAAEMTKEIYSVLSSHPEECEIFSQYSTGSAAITAAFSGSIILSGIRILSIIVKYVWKYGKDIILRITIKIWKSTKYIYRQYPKRIKSPQFWGCLATCESKKIASGYDITHASEICAHECGMYYGR